MSGSAKAPAATLIGRDRELAQIREFLSQASGVLLLEGEAGIGKTVLLHAGVDAARSSGWRVLLARPAASEATFAFAGVGDLLRDEVGQALDRLRRRSGGRSRSLFSSRRPHPGRSIRTRWAWPCSPPCQSSDEQRRFSWRSTTLRAQLRTQHLRCRSELHRTRHGARDPRSQRRLNVRKGPDRLRRSRGDGQRSAPHRPARTRGLRSDAMR